MILIRREVSLAAHRTFLFTFGMSLILKWHRIVQDNLIKKESYKPYNRGNGLFVLKNFCCSLKKNVPTSLFKLR